MAAAVTTVLAARAVLVARLFLAARAGALAAGKTERRLIASAVPAALPAMRLAVQRVQPQAEQMVLSDLPGASDMRAVAVAAAAHPLRQRGRAETAAIPEVARAAAVVR